MPVDHPVWVYVLLPIVGTLELMGVIKCLEPWLGSFPEEGFHMLVCLALWAVIPACGIAWLEQRNRHGRWTFLWGALAGWAAATLMPVVFPVAAAWIHPGYPSAPSELIFVWVMSFASVWPVVTGTWWARALIRRRGRSPFIVLPAAVVAIPAVCLATIGVMVGLG